MFFKTKLLREMTGESMKNCHHALQLYKGHTLKAQAYLRVKGLAVNRGNRDIEELVEEEYQRLKKEIYSED